MKGTLSKATSLRDSVLREAESKPAPVQTTAVSEVVQVPYEPDEPRPPSTQNINVEVKIDPDLIMERAFR